MLIDPYTQRQRQTPQTVGTSVYTPQAPPGGGGQPPPETGPPPPDATKPPPATPIPDTTKHLWGVGARPAQGRIKMGPNGPYWDPSDTGADQAKEGDAAPTAPTGTTTAATAAATPYPGTSVFDDPATKHFETLLNQRIQELLGPAYTPAQMDLQQTQALDPMEREHQAARQQVIQRLAAHGIPPSSGIVERALEDVDRSFQQLRTKTQAGFATKAIERTDANRNQAVGLASTIPNLAWSRLHDAGTNPLNSPQLLALLNAFQQSGYANSDAFMKTVMEILTQFAR
jgi:hypothetical protein